MSGRGGRGGGRVLLPPINAIFQLLQRQQKVSIWLYEQLGMRIEGTIKVSDTQRTLCMCSDWQKKRDLMSSWTLWLRMQSKSSNRQRQTPTWRGKVLVGAHGMIRKRELTGSRTDIAQGR